MQSFYHEGHVRVGEQDLHLVCNFRAITVIEELAKQGMDEILPQLVSPSHSLAVKVLYGMLIERHPGITLDEAAFYALGPDTEAVGIELAEVIKRAYPRAFGKPKDANPRRRRGASKST